MVNSSLSNLPKIEIKKVPEDFIVEEILPNGKILEVNKPVHFPDKEGMFTHFVLQKRDWDTNSAIRRIARALHISHKRFGHAGNKDKFAITTQRVSCFACDKLSLLSLKLRDITILGAWKEKSKVKLGDLAGNRFKIKIYPTDNDIRSKWKVNLLNYFFNFYGPQRFGTTRVNTHLIGKCMILGRYEEAVTMYLTDSTNERSQPAIDARNRLREEGDYKRALEYFPKYLKYERILLSHLSKYSNDYIGALRKLPRTTVLMFIHAYQSYLFNKELCYLITNHYIKDFIEDFDSKNISELRKIKLNIIGYETVLNEVEKMILEEEGVTTDMFKLKSMPELSSKGNVRNIIEKAVNPSLTDNVLCFSLSPGCYASVYLLHHFNVDSLPLPPGLQPQCMQESIRILSSLSF